MLLTFEWLFTVSLFTQETTTRLSVDVRDFGAVADGKADCLASIQRAIDKVSSAGGGTVFFPSSDRPYVVSGTIFVRSSDVNLSGDGATIQLAAGAASGTSGERTTESQVHVILVSGERDRRISDVTIRGLTIDANIDHQKDYYSPRGIVVEHASRVVIDGVTILRPFVGLDIGAGSSHCEVRNSVVRDWLEDAFDASGDADKGSGVITTHVRFVNCHAHDAPRSTGNAWEIEDGVRHILVEDCSVRDVPQGNAFGIRNHWTAGPVDVSRDIELRRVRVTNVGGRYGIYSHSAPRDRFPTNRLTDVRLVDTVCLAPVVFYGPIESIEVVGGRYGAIHLGWNYETKTSPTLDRRIDLVDTTVRIREAQVQHVNINAHAGVFELANVLVDATESSFDSAINLLGGSSALVLGCTITGARAAGFQLRQASPRIENSILWGNGASFRLEDAKPQLAHNCIQRGAPAEAVDEGGNLSSDPLFVSGPLGRLYLSQKAAGQSTGSPCIDAGNGLAAFLHLDERTTRTDGVSDTGTADIGFHYALKTTTVDTRVVDHANDEPLRIGSDKQIFLGPWTADGRDDHLVASMQGVTMTLNEAHVTGERLLDLDRPWESADHPDTWMYPRSWVLKDGDVFRMYYAIFPRYPLAHHFTCYAESTDGVHWTKPNLGLYHWDGSSDNNIVLPNDDLPYRVTDCVGATVFIDPHAKSPNEKYKLMALLETSHGDGYQPPGKSLPKVRKGQYAFSSPDGIRWSLMHKGRVNPGANDTQFSVFWDEAVGKYVSYTRVKREIPGLKEYYEDYQRRRYGANPRFEGLGRERSVGRMISDDFVNWSKETQVIAPDEIDSARLPKDLPRRMDFYGGNVVKYSEAPGAYVALPNAFYHWKLDEFDDYPITYWMKTRYLPSTMDVQLITSRDGVKWNRSPGRKPLIRLGPEGSFWSKTIWPSNVIRVGDELWIYFIGLDVAHSLDQDRRLGEILGRTKPHKGSHGRAVLRLDGFISADAAYTGGELVTKPLIFAGNRLQINVDTSAGGTVNVEIHDASGQAIDGFALEESDEINGNSVRMPVSWRGNTNLARLAGTPVSVRFVMRDAKIYSFQFLP